MVTFVHRTYIYCSLTLTVQSPLMHQLVDLFALPETTLYANVVEVSGIVNLWLVPLVHA